MSGFTLRPYQDDLVDRLRSSITNGNKRIIVHAPTGAGKTVIAAHLISLASDLNSRVLFLANRRELIFQAVSTLRKHGVDGSIIMAGEDSNLNNSVQVASMQTYHRRISNDNENIASRWTHMADLIIVDECHGSIAPTYQEILDNYTDKVIIGLTATPCRGDGRGLGERYDEIISSVSIVSLIDDGYLVPPRYYVPSTPDLDAIKTVAGDYHKGELGKRVDQPKLIGDIYENWLKNAAERKTIIFATNVKHSLHIVEKFKRGGVEIEHIDAKTPKDERAEILHRLMNGDLQAISNVGILCEGFDFPAASCIVLARPTKSLGLYIQMSGRGLRISDGKQDCLIMDHSGCIENHGLLEWDREWSLDGKKKAWSERKLTKEDPPPITCDACHFVFERQSECPACGTPIKDYAKMVGTYDAELEELQALRDDQDEKVQRRRYYGMLKYYCRSKGWKKNAPDAKYRARYGVWPNQNDIGNVEEIIPDVAFLGRMKYEQIRFAKSVEAKG